MMLHCCLVRSVYRLHRPSEAGYDYGCTAPPSGWTVTTVGEGWDRTE